MSHTHMEELVVGFDSKARMSDRTNQQQSLLTPVASFVKYTDAAGCE